MSNSREAILDSIRHSLSEHRGNNGKKFEMPEKPYVRPVYVRSRIDEFMARAAKVQMTVERFPEDTDIVKAVSDYIEAQAIASAEASLDISPELNNYDWSIFQQSFIGQARAETRFSVTACIAAVAETGSIVLASGEGHPSTLNFLPECHIVVVRESQVCAYLEDVWPLVRDYKTLPRVININTGPSRTGDIEQTIEVGAHGPRVMHVLLISG